MRVGGRLRQLENQIDLEDLARGIHGLAELARLSSSLRQSVTVQAEDAWMLEA